CHVGIARPARPALAARVTLPGLLRANERASRAVLGTSYRDRAVTILAAVAPADAETIGMRHAHPLNRISDGRSLVPGRIAEHRQPRMPIEHQAPELDIGRREEIPQRVQADQ